MKNTLISCIFLLTAVQMLSAQNLIRNGDFDKPLNIECRFDAAPGVQKSGIFTENATWNKCLKLEVAKYVSDRNGRRYFAMVRIGGDAKNNGFPVKPNTLYSYSLELKGTTGAIISAWEWNGPNYWKGMKKIKSVKGKTGSKASEEWTALRGTFQTSADATHAAIAVSLWGEERYKNLPPIGSYILIDKVKVEEKADLLGNFKKPAAVSVSAPLKKVIVPGTDARGFVEYKTGMNAKADTIVLAEPGTRAVKLKIRCLEPAMDKLRHAVTDNGQNVWKDDCVEIFFAPVKNDRALSQFVIAAGGGRWMGRGTDQAVEDYGRWSARVSMEKDAWTVEAEIPYALLGWDGEIAPGSMIPFNVARNRTPVREASSLAFANGSFHNVKQFAVLLLDTPEACFQALRKKRLAEAEQGAPDNLKRKIAEWKRDSDPAEMLRKSEQFQQELRSAKLGTRTFVLTETAPSSDPTIPMLPAEIAAPPEKIAIRAAGNEFKALPLALTNLLDRPEEYRIVITALDKRGAEEKGLRNASGEFFPPEKIRLFRGVRVKDGDEKTHGLRFDPLAPMDITSTVVVMPDQATPVWAIFDTSGVTPGRYSGVIRVIPLGQAVTMKNKRVVKTSTSDLPFELEVLPFELSRTPALPQFYFGSAYGNREIFRMMLDYGINVPLINTWGFNVRYQPDGSVRECRTSGPEREIRRILEWAQEAGMEKDIQIGVAYSAYKIFCDIHAKKQFKFGTPEWEKAWRGHIRAIEEVRKKCGVPNERFFVELWDEPHAKDMQEVLRSVEIAHETAPEMNFMITFASWEIPPGELEKLIPYLSHWCFWSTKYFTDKKYAPLLQRLRAEGKNISFYTCETTMRLDLQKYYLTHPWRALACNLDMCNLYQFLTYRYATDDWKRSSYGNVALIASGHPVSTIRLENLRIGSTDLKYMAKLAEVLKQSDTQDKTLRAEAERFLKETPERVGITRAHDPSARAEAREKAIDLILKLTGQPKH